MAGALPVRSSGGALQWATRNARQRHSLKLHWVKLSSLGGRRASTGVKGVSGVQTQPPIQGRIWLSPSGLVNVKRNTDHWRPLAIAQIEERPGQAHLGPAALWTNAAPGETRQQTGT